MRDWLPHLLAASLLLGAAGCPDEETPSPDASPTPDAADAGVGDADDAGDSASDAGGVDADDPEDADREPSDAGPTWDFGRPDTSDDDELDIQQVVPPRGPVDGGNRVRVVGSAFDDDTEVYFGSRRMEANVSGGAIVGSVPEGMRPGPVDVKVVADDGTSAVLEEGYTYLAGVSVDTVTPSTLPTDGGVQVTIRGGGFTKPVAVSIGGETARQVERIDDGLIRAVAPAGRAGEADLRVTTEFQSRVVEDAVTYVEPLEVRGVRPASGPVAGGTVAEVDVAGVGRSATVDVGGREADVLSVDPAEDVVEIEVPAGMSPGLVDVAVHSRGDSAIASDAYWYRNSDDPALVAADPAMGPADGGTEVTLMGAGLDVEGPTVTFGGEEATVVETAPTRLRVETPAHSPATVDVVVESNGTEVARGEDLFDYRESLWIDDVEPASGSAQGGTDVTLRGEGFGGVERVEFGGIPADFTVVSSTEIAATTPEHSAGLVDVEVRRGGLTAELEDGFTFTAPVEVWGFSPTRGSVSGGTYVEIRGRGFAGTIDVTFDGTEAEEVRRLDANNLYVYTPAHSPGSASVEVSVGERSASAPYPFEYFNPTSRRGGASGGPVEGAVNVSVLARGGGPVEGAFVMLSTRSDTVFTGTTDASGRVTLSGPDLRGPQTVTATAKGFSSATVQEVDAENITVFLTRSQASNGGGGGGGGGPPSGEIHGTVESPPKHQDPGRKLDYEVAVVRVTQPEVGRRGLAPGPGSVVVGEGRYSITSRIGDVAVVAMCGRKDEETDEFIPEYIGVERYVNISDGDRKEIDLVCDIPLDESLEVKLENPIYAPGGPNTNRVEVYWDFGFEGVFPSPVPATGPGELMRVDKLPPLEGKLSDVTLTVNGGSFTGQSSPSSQTTIDGVEDLASRVDLPPLVEIPEPVVPRPGGELTGNEIRFQTSGPYYPDFFTVYLLNEKGRPFWQYVLPGDASAVRLPELPDLSFLPEDQRPEPMAEGQVYALFIGVDSRNGRTIDSFSYEDLAYSGWRGYSTTRWSFTVPSQ